MSAPKTNLTHHLQWVSHRLWDHVIIIAAALITSAIAFASYQATRGSIMVYTQQRLLAEAQAEVAPLERWLARHKTAVITMASSPTLKNLDQDSIETDWLQLYDSSSPVLFGALVQPDGSLWTTGGDTELVKADHLRTFFQDNRAQSITVSDPFRIASEQSPIILIMSPIEQHSQIVGGWILGVQLDPVITQLSPMPYGVESGMVAFDGKGHLFMASPIELESDLQTIQHNLEIEGITPLENQSHYLVHWPLQEANWSVSLVIPEQILNAQLQPLNWMFAIVLGLTNLLIFLLHRVQTSEQQRLQQEIQKRENINHQLQASETRHQAILAAIPDLMFRLRSDGIYVDYVKSNELLDLLPSDFNPIGQPITLFLPSQVVQRHLHYMRKAISTQQLQVYEQRVSLKGFPHYEEVRVIADGPNEALFMIRDINSRKQAELALKEAEARYRDIYDNAIEGIYQSTPDGRYLSVNQALATLYGFRHSRDAIAYYHDIGAQLYVDPHRRQEFKEWLEDEGSLVNFESQVYRQDGSILWISETARVVYNSEGHLLYYEGFVSDITIRKAVEMALQQRNQELAKALQDLKTTQEGLIQSEKMAALGHLIASVAHEINTPLGAIQSSAGNITKYLDQTLYILPNLFHTLSSAENDCFLALLHRSLAQEQPLSGREERKIRRQLRSSLEESGVSEAESIAETLVLMGIKGDLDPFLSLLNKENALHILDIAYKLSGLHRSNHTIQLAVSRSSKVVFALKNYARYDLSEDPIEAQVLDGIETVLTLYHGQLKRGVEVRRHYAVNLPTIECYPDELNQIWTNLIHNSIQAMAGQGSLTISAHSHTNGIQIQITDTGCGIPESIQTRIFEPFFTTKPAGEGSGLGLHISQKIIDKHRGSIRCASQPGHTTFTIQLPLTISRSDNLPSNVPIATGKGSHE